MVYRHSIRDKTSIMSSQRSKILSLYKQLLRTSAHFSNYNFRNYVLRRVKDGFKDAKGESNHAAIESFISEAEQQLALVKRQTTIGQMFQEQKVVLEAMKSKPS